MKNTEKRLTAGRPAVPDELKKGNRGLSLTNAEHQELWRQADAVGLGTSAYIIARLKLS